MKNLYFSSQIISKSERENDYNNLNNYITKLKI